MRKFIFVLLACSLILCGCRDKEKFIEEENEMSQTIYYYYNQLTNKEKEVYDVFLNNLKSLKKEFDVPTSDTAIVRRVCEVILYDHPEIFWFSGACNQMIYKNHITIEPDYSYSSYEVTKLKNQIDNNISPLISQIQYLSDYEKVKTVYEYVVKTVDYVEGAKDNQTIVSSLVYKKSVCAGYSRALQYILQKAGMEVLYVPGNVSNKGAHAWNIVKINGSYYQVDVTFGDRDSNGKKKNDDLPKELEVNYTYLCMADQDMLKNRVIQTSVKVPKCTKSDLNYYALNHLLQASFNESKLKENIKTAIYSGKNYWQAQFKNYSDYSLALSAIKNNMFTNVVLDYLVEKKGIYSVSSTYIHDKDHYVLTCWY